MFLPVNSPATVHLRVKKTPFSFQPVICLLGSRLEPTDSTSVQRVYGVHTFCFDVFCAYSVAKPSVSASAVSV